ELCQSLILLAHERIRQAEHVVRIGERAARRDHLLEEVDGPVVVLQLEPLPGLLDEVLSADVHASPRTSGRTVECLPRSRPRAGTPARARRGAGPPRRAARRRADPRGARSAPRAPAS